MKVYVLLCYDYGDQGVDYLGVFSTSEKAEEFIVPLLNEYRERQDYIIKESEVL